MISNTVRLRVIGYLEGFIDGLASQHKPGGSAEVKSITDTDKQSKEGRLMPFHRAILPPELRRVSAFERSFSTKLGSTFEWVAMYIAKEAYADAQRNFRLLGAKLPESWDAEIGRIIAENNSGTLTLPYPELVARVQAQPVTQLVTRPLIADLLITKSDSSLIFIEIKSPKPNKGQCLEVAERLLRASAYAAYNGRYVETYYGMAYNPYGTRALYSHPYPKKHLDMDNLVLIGSEFWQLVGNDPDTYDIVLSIYEDVGRAKGKALIDQLAFGFNT